MSAAKPGKLRVVLDSNVYVSAFTHPQGPVFELWRQALEQRYTLIVSPPIIHEVARCLRLDFGWSEARLVRRMKLLVKIAEIVAPTEPVTFIIDDPDDNRILECGLAGSADVIVSGDRHINKLKTFRGIAIVRPMDFRRMLGQ